MSKRTKTRAESRLWGYFIFYYLKKKKKKKKTMELTLILNMHYFPSNCPNMIAVSSTQH